MLQVKAISFGYSAKKQIVKNLSFSVPKGTVYGFLGANGAGKTTTIRLILNLLKPSSGEILIDGEQFNSSGNVIYKGIGSLIEQPTFYGHLTGFANLKLWATYYKVSSQRIDEVLEMVQLGHAKNDKAKNYSQGMKQRLGIATALLHSPKLLILDEPLNGLDPKGIKEIRSLFLNLKNNGITIFLSSHILSEIEATCDRLCIIDQGQLKFEGTIKELNVLLTKEILFQLRTNNQQQAKTTLEGLGFKHSSDERYLTITLKSEEDISSIIEKLVQSGIQIYEVKKNESRLEDLYLTLTEGE